MGGERRSRLDAARCERLVDELRELAWLDPGARPRVGVSSCLLGEAVRWDGGHKLDAPLAADLARWAEVVETCPEVGMGLPVPRPPLAVALREGEARLIERDSGRDHGDALARFAAARLAGIGAVDAWVFKSRSPSCGLRGVAVVGEAGGVAARGAGLFARAVRRAHPRLPLAEEGELRSAAARAAWRFVAEWRLAARRLRDTTRVDARRLHRKLRGLWLEVSPATARRLDRAAAHARDLDAYLAHADLALTLWRHATPR